MSNPISIIHVSLCDFRFRIWSINKLISRLQSSEPLASLKFHHHHHYHRPSRYYSFLSQPLIQFFSFYWNENNQLLIEYMTIFNLIVDFDLINHRENHAITSVLWLNYNVIWIVQVFWSVLIYIILFVTSSC